MPPASCLPTVELTRLQGEHARLTTALQTVARTYGSTWKDIMVVSRQITLIEDAIRVAMTQQAPWQADR